MRRGRRFSSARARERGVHGVKEHRFDRTSTRLATVPDDSALLCSTINASNTFRFPLPCSHEDRIHGTQYKLKKKDYFVCIWIILMGKCCDVKFLAVEIVTTYTENPSVSVSIQPQYTVARKEANLLCKSQGLRIAKLCSVGLVH